MVDFLKIWILRDNNDIHVKFRWVGEDTTFYLLNHMNAFTLEHVLLWKKDTNTYSEHDVDSIKWLNSLLIASSTDELNILVNKNFDLLPMIEQGGIVCLNIVIDEMFFVSEAVLRALNTWLKQYSQ